VAFIKAFLQLMMFPTSAQADGEGVGGSAAACAEIFEGLGMTWWARGKQAHFMYPIFKVEHCSSLYSWFVACATTQELAFLILSHLMEFRFCHFGLKTRVLLALPCPSE